MSTESTLWMGDIKPWMNEDIIMKSFTLLGIKPKSIKMIKDKKLKDLSYYFNYDMNKEVKRVKDSIVNNLIK